MSVASVGFDTAPGARESGTISLIRPTIAAFVGRTALGPVDEPVRIRSVTDFQRIFGAHVGYSFLPQAVQQFFQHGGHEALVVRVANRATRGQIDIAAGEQTLCLQAADPGSDVHLRASVDHERVETQRDKFNLVVQQLGGRGSEVVRDQEIFRAVSTNPADPRFVGTLLEESKLVRLSGPVPGLRPRATAAKHPGDPLPYVPMSRFGTDGEALTDYDIIGSNEERTGLFALERAARFDVLCIPPAPGAEIGTTSFIAAERYSRLRNALFVWDPPESWITVADVVAAMRTGTWTGRNVVTYFPRIRRRGDAFRLPAGMPACGAIAGSIALADSCGVWVRDAAVGALLKTSLTPVSCVDDRAAGLLRRIGVNVLDSPAGRGTPIQPIVTAAGAGASAWRDFHLRRLLLFVVDSIAEASAAASWRRRDKPARLARQIEDFLRELHARGAFAGATQAQSYFVSLAGDADHGAVRFGIALRRPGELTCFEVGFAERRPRLRALPALETGQLAS